MNRYEQYISDYLIEYKEVSLEKIGVLKLLGNHADPATNALPVEFTFDRKAVTTQELINYIAQQSAKNKMLIASDLEDHLKQSKEFINIGKTYQLPRIGFIKANNKGEYALNPSGQTVKMPKNFNKPERTGGNKKTGSSVVQFFTLLIVLAIIAGLGYEGYQYFVKPKPQIVSGDSLNNDTSTTMIDTNKMAADSAVLKNISATPTYDSTDTILVHYIFETTNLLIRAKSRTEKLISYGNDAGYDSVSSGSGKLYSLYFSKKTRIADTAFIKDSLAKFLQKDITLKIISKQ